MRRIAVSNRHDVVAVGRTTLLRLLFVLCVVVAVAAAAAAASTSRSDDENAHDDDGYDGVGDTQQQQQQQHNVTGGGGGGGGGGEVGDSEGDDDEHGTTTRGESYKNKGSDVAEAEGKTLMARLAAERQKVSPSIAEYQFNINRVRPMSRIQKVPESTSGILYWMYRDQRVDDNWALLYAQKLAIQNKLPLHVAFCSPQNNANMTLRQYTFMTEGLKQVEIKCQYLNIEFHYLFGEAKNIIPNFVRTHNMGAVVVDFTPLREHSDVIKQLSLAIGDCVPVIQVDAHNIVPCWKVSNTQQRAPAGIRNIMNLKLKPYLTTFPPVIRHPYDSKSKARPTNWKAAYEQTEIDHSIEAIPSMRGGYINGIRVLNEFLKHKLEYYSTNRYNPVKNGLSNLSPWLHFGQVSAQRVLFEVLKFEKLYPESVQRYKEEILIRRELSDNFCFFNDDYDNFKGAPEWGRITLDNHRKDRRRYRYTRLELEHANTHDDIWNVAHMEMVKFGKLHRFLRPYWAKKILEYSDSPETAIATAIYLNNKYSLDGSDPTGYSGIMWAITGLHDKPLNERPIFGEIRYISYMGCKTKFNSTGYMNKVLGPPHQ